MLTLFLTLLSLQKTPTYKCPGKRSNTWNFRMEKYKCIQEKIFVQKLMTAFLYSFLIYIYSYYLQGIGEFFRKNYGTTTRSGSE